MRIDQAKGVRFLYANSSNNNVAAVPQRQATISYQFIANDYWEQTEIAETDIVYKPQYKLFRFYLMIGMCWIPNQTEPQ